jgi:hypothetical protein
MGTPFTADDLGHAIAETAKLISIPYRNPEWVKPSWWAWPLNVTRTRGIPPTAGFVDYINIQLGQTDLAPVGYSIKVCAFVGTTENDPLVNGVTYRFLRNGVHLPAQEFNITNTIEKHLDRYTSALPFPAFGRKLFLNVTNDGRLQLQVNNPSGLVQVGFCALYGYYYPNLGDLDRGGMESAAGRDGHEDGDRDG